jgi:hypothetical protein
MTLRIYTTDELPQRSEEWLKARAGMATASIIGQLVTTKPRTGIDFDCEGCDARAGEPCRHKRTGLPVATIHPERTAAAKADTSPPVLTIADNAVVLKVAELLASERIDGPDPDGELGGKDIWRGVDSEPYAIAAYSQHNGGIEVTQVGLMVLEAEDYFIGLSPDGLVGDEGGVEVKAPRKKGHVHYVTQDCVPPEHMAQIQTALLVTGRQWWDFVSFKGGMRLWVKRVYPDPDWFVAIHAAVAALENVIADLLAIYEANTAGFPMTERLPDFNEVSLKL